MGKHVGTAPRIANEPIRGVPALPHIYSAPVGAVPGARHEICVAFDLIPEVAGPSTHIAVNEDLWNASLAPAARGGRVVELMAGSYAVIESILPT